MSNPLKEAIRLLLELDHTVATFATMNVRSGYMCRLCGAMSGSLPVTGHRPECAVARAGAEAACLKALITDPPAEAVEGPASTLYARAAARAALLHGLPVRSWKVADPSLKAAYREDIRAVLISLGEVDLP